MRIGIDVSACVSKKGGIGVYVANLIKELSQIDDHNRYILLHIFFKKKVEIFEKNTFPTNFSSRGYRLPWRIISKLCLKFGFPTIEFLAGEMDVFHSTSHFHWPQKKGKKLATVHDLIIFKMPHLFPSQWRQFYEESISKIIFNKLSSFF